MLLTAVNRSERSICFDTAFKLAHIEIKAFKTLFTIATTINQATSNGILTFGYTTGFRYRLEYQARV
jgi:hypothetical protein